MTRYQWSLKSLPWSSISWLMTIGCLTIVISGCGTSTTHSTPPPPSTSVSADNVASSPTDPLSDSTPAEYSQQTSPPAIQRTSALSNTTLVPADTNSIDPIAATLPGRIYFARDREGDLQSLLLRLEKGIEEQILIGKELDVSPDGSYAIARLPNDRSEHWRADTYLLQNLTTNHQETFDLDIPIWGRRVIPAPNGIHLAITYECPNEARDILLTTITQVQQLNYESFYQDHCPDDIVYAPNNGESLSWLPDSTAVILAHRTSLVPTPGEALIQRKLHGQDWLIYQLPDGYTWGNVRVSADGRWVLANYRGDAHRLGIFDIQSGRLEQVNLSGYTASGAVISPDARYILFNENSGDNQEHCLYLYDLQAPEQEPVCLVRGYQVFAWSPDP